MLKTSFLTSACAAIVLSTGMMLTTQQASAATMVQDCATQWKTMKAAKTVPAGMKRKDFEKKCAADAAAAGAAAPATKPAAAATAPATKPAPAATAPATKPAAAATAPATKPAAAATAPATKPAAAATAPATKPAAAVTAPATKPVAAATTKPMDGKAKEKSRIKACGVEWKAAKAANKVPAGQTWPQFWSECNTRLKAAGK